MIEAVPLPSSRENSIVFRPFVEICWQIVYRLAAAQLFPFRQPAVV